MEWNDLSLRSTEESNSRFTYGALSAPAEVFETTSGPEPGVRAELRGEKAGLKLLLEVANQIVSNRELRDVVRALMMSIRNGIRCDGVCISLASPEGGELQVYTLDFPGEAEFQESTTIPVSGTISQHVFQTAKPWFGSCEERRAHFPGQLLLPQECRSTCMLPIPGRKSVVGTLGLVRSEDSFSQDEIGFLMQVSNQIGIALENALAYQQIRELKEKLGHENVYLQDEIRNEANFEEIVGTSTVLRRVLAQVETVAPTDSTVLIYGETGTGKELIARAIHNLSSRHNNTFVKLNCAAIPTGLLESELFGHEKGAFTGAISQRIGRFELASRGTVFLDEVGELPLELQPKLLRVLQEREFERLGSTRTLTTDARLIAATNRPLAQAVSEGKFRQDLFYRLDVFPVEVPPLRERREDIPLLSWTFVKEFSNSMGKAIEAIADDSMAALLTYPWPGNVRELRNVIERAMILTRGPTLQIKLGHPTLRPQAAKSAATLDEAERDHILRALERCGWRIRGANAAAEQLGVKPTTLESRIKKLGLVQRQ